MAETKQELITKIEQLEKELNLAKNQATQYKQNAEDAYKKMAQMQEEYNTVLLKCRAKLQLFKDMFKNNYAIALNIKED